MFGQTSGHYSLSKLMHENDLHRPSVLLTVEPIGPSLQISCELLSVAVTLIVSPNAGQLVILSSDFCCEPACPTFGDKLVVVHAGWPRPCCLLFGHRVLSS